MQTAMEKLIAQQRIGTVRIVYDRILPEDRVLPCPPYWDADFMCKDPETLDRLLVKHGIPLIQKGSTHA